MLVVFVVLLCLVLAWMCRYTCIFCLLVFVSECVCAGLLCLYMYVCVHTYTHMYFWVVQCVVCICLMFVVDTNAERAYFFVICLLFCFLSAHISVCHVYRAICT